MRLTGSFQTIVIHGESSRASWLVSGCVTSTGAVLTAVPSPGPQCPTPPMPSFHSPAAGPPARDGPSATWPASNTTGEPIRAGPGGYAGRPGAGTYGPTARFSPFRGQTITSVRLIPAPS